MTSEFLTDFYVGHIYLTDRVLPLLRPAEALICVHIFSRTVGMGVQNCRISYGNLHDLTGFTIPTIRTAIAGLIEKGKFIMTRDESIRTARSYRFVMPDSLGVRKSRLQLQRDPQVMLKEQGVASYENILEKLTQEDKDMLKILVESLSPYEYAKFINAAKEQATNGESAETKMKELVVLSKFGPERLKKYMQ